MLRQNKKIEDTIQAAYKRNRRNSPVRGQPKFGTTSRDPVHGRSRRGGGGGLGLNPNAPNDLVTGKRSRRMSEGFRRYGRKAPTRKVENYGPWLNKRGGGRVGRRASSSAGGRRGRVGTGLAGTRRRTSSSPASRLSDRQRQQMKKRFNKAAADSRARRFGYRHRNRSGIMAGDGSKALRGRNARPAPKNKPRVMGMPRQIENRYRRRR